MLRWALMAMLVAPGVVGFLAGFSPRSLAIILLASLVATVMYAGVLGCCKVAGEADERAGAPRG